MGKKLKSEEDVKRELEIVDFNDVSNEQIKKFIEMIPNIDKEVALKIASQFPNYTKFATDTINSLSLMSKEAIKIADDGAKETILAYQKIIDTIAEHLKDGELSKEERENDINLMIELAKKIDEIDDKKSNRISEIVKEHSKNVLKVAGIIGVAIVAIALGSKSGDDGKK